MPTVVPVADPVSRSRRPPQATTIVVALVALALSTCRLSYTTTSTSTSSSSSSGAPPPTLITCIPASCFYLCVTQGTQGTSSIPTLSPSCPVHDPLTVGVSEAIATWVQGVINQDCAPGDNNKQFLPPQAIACGDGCPADPDKLPPSCLAVCDGTPTPALVGCPLNNATASFIADLQGVTCDPGGGYSEIHPDPSLVNPGTCLRVLPGDGAGGGGGGGAGAGGAGGGREDAGGAGGAGGA
jgi:uncharacterized membrane protein YgcG